jgi:hypothetical protein
MCPHTSEPLVDDTTANHDEVGMILLGDPPDHIRHITAF